jgi:7,8-dihydropterin-6-yl-methyl-4-(beta-D-ribofuranosyl)aminobenzene 5'-phosphate synthase
MKLKNMAMLAGLFAGIALFAGCAAPPAAQPAATAAATAKPQITVLYDAFGKDASMKKDWGFAALIEVGGKRILFDTGNNSDIFAHNVKAKGVDLSKLDFVIMSHRHGDHMGGLNHLLSVNPNVKIYAPKEAFGVYGAALPGTFYRKNESLPPEQRYFDGKPPETLRFGTPWPKGNFTYVAERTEVAPGMYLIPLKGEWGVDLPVMEISLAIDTPEGTVLVVGCSHPTIEKIVEAAKTAINKPVHLVVGGTHLLPAKDDEIQRIAASLSDNVKWLAAAHCTGEPAFAILQKTFGDRYLYAGVGTVLALGPNVGARSLRGEAARLAGDDLVTYRMFARTSHDGLDYKLALSVHAHD